MAKTFMEVFPSLKVNGELSELLQTTEVTKISANHEHTHIRIYLYADRLIFKKSIWELEKTIHDQLFSGGEMKVSVIERFRLSRQYTQENLYEMYRESMLEELGAHSAIAGNMLRGADMKFGENGRLQLTLEDTLLAHRKSEEVVAYLEKVFCERCGMDLIVHVNYKKPKESKYRKHAEEQIRQEVQQIIARTRLGEHGEEAGDGSSAEVLQEGSGEESGKQGDKPGIVGVKSRGDGDTTGVKQKGVTAPSRGGNKTSSDQSKDRGSNKSSGAKNKGAWGDRGARRSMRKSDNPDVIYGRDFDDETMEIASIDDPMNCVIRGKVLSVDTREIRDERTIVMFTMTDFTDTIGLKVFISNEELPELMKEIKSGAFLKVKGMAAMDTFDHDLTISSVAGIRKIPDFTTTRMDNSPVKRVELHCHTKMSDFDGVSDVVDIVKCAMKWGMPALAVTDHGNVQAFPEANHAIDDKFKMIYGVEAYLVDDTKAIVTDSRGQALTDAYVVFDLETTGFSPEVHKIIEIGAVKVAGGKIIDKFSAFVNPGVPIPPRIENLTHIRDDMVMDAPVIEQILPKFMEFCEDCVMVAHNADFDMSFIRKNCKDQGINCEPTVIDTVALARVLLPALNRFKLDTVAKALNISLENHHRAVDDAGCTAEIFVRFIQMLGDRGITQLDEIDGQFSNSVNTVRKLPTYHAIILATCDQGRTNLYHLISLSHIKYFHKRPRIPKSEFLKYRDGLLIGSACEAGELYRAILNGRPEQEIARIVEFYDYLEIQPLGNNAFMLRNEDSPVATEEDLMDINRRIVRLGEEFRKPVVATCDVHFLNPEDEIYRRIIMAGRGFDDADEQPPLYLRTTEEMLKEFEYLGSAKAEEIVITNTNKIADMCERISPVRPDKCPPIIENSDQMLRDICHKKAFEMYGDPLPAIVEERLERELNSIISNGYAVMYIIAQKLVWKSVEDGYLVGSRGSVGSSFVATMSGITEVNPLHAHYLCKNPECKYSDFDSELVQSFTGRSGCDMPDAVCPRCGQPLSKEGFDIPFETFLGFKGDKEPDIDLNFSGEYQSKAHKYTEVIFGEGQTYKAGTIGTLAEKTAFGFVKNYYEERGRHKRKCEIERITTGCVGVRRTTGQHPGGIVVLPMGEEINTFTPIQCPANKIEEDIITTHFDYHSIDHNLLKLDILGHDDPTMIRMLQDLTGLDPTSIPLDDPSVMSLFQSTKALGIEPEDIHGCKLGALGIPEFGTDFAMGMLMDTQPKEFSDLVRIAGLSHGTDVWLGNAQTLIQEGKATISTCICTRDDIMIYLISMGLDPEESFKIMEAVRKGMVAKGKAANWPQWKQDMIDHNVPDWYIWSCEKIKYMFPKAHAAAYVMMAWRIAYFKVFYPLAYYAAYFSIRATAFSYEMMCQGPKRLEPYLNDLEKRSKVKSGPDALSKKEQDIYKDMRIVQEMYARGYEFTPIQLEKAHPNRFQIIDGKLMASFNSIDDLGDTAAVAIAEAVKDGPFLSKDDFRQRTKVSAKVTDMMSELGILGNLPESNQLSLFDFGA